MQTLVFAKKLHIVTTFIDSLSIRMLALLVFWLGGNIHAYIEEILLITRCSCNTQ